MIGQIDQTILCFIVHVACYLHFAITANSPSCVQQFKKSDKLIINANIFHKKCSKSSPQKFVFIPFRDVPINRRVALNDI